MCRNFDENSKIQTVLEQFCLFSAEVFSTKYIFLTKFERRLGYSFQGSIQGGKSSLLIDSSQNFITVDLTKINLRKIYSSQKTQRMNRIHVVSVNFCKNLAFFILPFI